MTTHKHETRKLTDLTIHPFLKDSPMLATSHPDFRNLVAAMMNSGLDDHPVVINDSNWIMDGRHRVMAARELGWDTAPVIIKPETDALTVIYDSLVARRHMFKWQIAYSIAPVIERLIEQGVTKRVGNLIPGAVHGHKNDQKPLIPSKGADCTDTQTATLLLEQMGIEITAWKRVQEVRRRFDKRPDLKAQYEPRMFLSFTDENAISLEGVMKAIGAKDAYENAPPDLKAKRGEYDRLALDYMKKASAQLEFWDKLGESKQKQVAEKAVETVRMWPPELKSEILKALQDDQKHGRMYKQGK
jgi:hypothetical protein